jgi:hypothetical protein
LAPREIYIGRDRCRIPESMTKTIGLPLVLVGCVFAGIATAHHGVANFDLNTEIQLKGTVRSIVLVNPHSWLHFDATDPNGRVAAWQCELRGASVLRRSGWSPEMFKPGTPVTITAAPDRYSPNTCYLGTIAFADGTRIDRYGQIKRDSPRPAERPLRLANGQLNISGDWAAEQRMLTDPRGMSGAFLPMSAAQQLEPGAVPEGAQAFPGTRGTAVSLAKDPIGAYWNRPSAMPLTDAGRKAIEGFDGASTDNPRLRCEPTNILFDWGFESDINHIVQLDDRILLSYGSMGLERTIYLNLTEPPSGVTPSRAGYSIGHWEADVLVVETTGFTPGILSADGRVPHSAELRVVERFSLDPSTGGLRRSYVAEDPLFFAGQYTGADTVYLSDLPYQRQPCDDLSFKSGKESRASLAITLVIAAAALVGLLILWRLTRRIIG